MRRSLILLYVLFASIPAAAEEVRVFAAASLTDVLKDIAKDYEQTTGDRILFNFGSSSMLARQIQVVWRNARDGWRRAPVVTDQISAD